MPRIKIALAVAVAALAYAPAAHAGNWVTSGPLSPAGRGVDAPQLAATPSGERVIAWIDDNATFTPENVSIRIAPPGGDFGPTQTFPAFTSGLETATAADGTVAIGWIDAGTVRVARLAPGATSFVEATPFVPPGGERPIGLDIAFKGRDVVGALLSATNNGRTRSVWAVGLAAGDTRVLALPGAATTGALEHIDDTGGTLFFEDVHVAADGGRATVGWVLESTSTTKTQVKFSTLATGAAGFSFPQTVDSEANTGTTRVPEMTPVVAAGGGHAYVVWKRDDSGTVFFEDIAAAAPAVRPIVGVGGSDVATLRAGADASGALVAAWAGEPDGADNASVFSAIVPAGETSGVAVPLTPLGVEREVGDLAVASDGTALVLPVRGGEDNTLEVAGSLRIGNGQFAVAEDVSGLQDDNPFSLTFNGQSAAVAPGGRALALWQAADRSGTPNSRLYLSERDSTPPTLTNLNVPATAVAGKRVAFSVTAKDDLSEPTVTWDFGDGTTARGASVMHIFGAAGRTTVTATARDSAGIPVQQTAVVAVMPAPDATADGGGADAGPGPGGGAAGVPAVDTTPPLVTRLASSNPRFRVARSATAVIAAKKAKRTAEGTVLRMMISERATLAIDVSRKQGKRLVGTLVRATAGPGPASVPFSGRIGKAALAPGTYVASVTAIDGAGNRSASATVNFTIARR